MRLIDIQRHNEKTLLFWQAVAWRLERSLVTPRQVADAIGHSEDYVRKGLAGEPKPVRIYLRPLCELFNVSSYREGRSYEDTVDALSDEELEEYFTRPVRSKRTEY